MKTQNFCCYVVVRGDATNPIDENVAGVYEVEVSVSTSTPINLDKLTAIQEHQITKAVLDEFHDNVGIKMLDDFAIVVYLESGIEIAEGGCEGAADANAMFFANYSETVDSDSLPKALRFLGEEHAFS